MSRRGRKQQREYEHFLVLEALRRTPAERKDAEDYLMEMRIRIREGEQERREVEAAEAEAAARRLARKRELLKIVSRDENQATSLETRKNGI